MYVAIRRIIVLYCENENLLVLSLCDRQPIKYGTLCEQIIARRQYIGQVIRVGCIWCKWEKRADQRHDWAAEFAVAARVL